MSGSESGTGRRRPEASRAGRSGGYGGPAGPDGAGEGDRGEETPFEAELRVLLSRDAAAVRPEEAPYPQILRAGRAERRRRLIAAGAALVALAAVPAVASAVGAGPGRSAGPAADAGPDPGPVAERPSAPPPAPAGPAGPATPGQLVDGITLEQAARGLESCLETERRIAGDMPGRPGPGSVHEYRILLAHRSTGNANAPGDGVHVVAVRDRPEQHRLICTLRDGRATGVAGSSGADGPPGAAVTPDINSGKLYLQSFTPGEPWVFPFRWGHIGTVGPDTARVTVEYGGSTVEAAVDHGWYAATGVLAHGAAATPRVRGYDAGGRELYDSDRDVSYQKELP
ncbi:hypothetical protein [Streptomyces sp. NPDC097619]|uniref:hypothetical protein n=1 Tax=Streptomyces sp. NPDC097619 TaxID=3157228 RepID=UPI0033206E30